MQYLQLKGCYYEIGYAFGKSRRGIDTFSTPSDERMEFALKCEEELKDHAPDLHDELRGFSDGIGLDHDIVVATVLAPDMLFECNLFFVRGECTTNGHPIFVRHMDWTEESLKRLVMLESNPNGRHTSLGFNFADMGCFDGINEVGLAIGTASVPFFTGKKNGVGLLENFSTRWSLDNFSKVEEVVDYLKNIPHTQAIIFLVADSTGTSARVECSPMKVEAEIVNKDLNIVNNFFMLDDMKEHDGMPKDDRAYAYHNRIKEWFSQTGKRITSDDIKRICRSHDSGICEHLYDPLGGTIYSWFSELDTDEIHLAIGYPCSNEYHTYRLGI
ncbi:MAG: C45 family autoproteolytic acyltransferase/hydrolase [Candidatus Thorarchaeota archaeon]